MVYKRLESSILPEEVRETKSFEEVFDLYYLGTKMHDISGNGILSKVGVAYGKDKQDKIYELNNPVSEFYVQRTFHDDWFLYPLFVVAKNKVLRSREGFYDRRFKNSNSFL